MKMYSSLVFRELKLTRRHFLLMLILFLLLALLMLTPIMHGGFSKPAEGEDAPVEIILLFVGTVSLTGGFLAGTNNGLQKADISSGWKRYSYVLPPTAGQQQLPILERQMPDRSAASLLSFVLCRYSSAPLTSRSSTVSAARKAVSSK